MLRSVPSGFPGLLFGVRENFCRDLQQDGFVPDRRRFRMAEWYLLQNCRRTVGDGSLDTDQGIQANGRPVPREL